MKRNVLKSHLYITSQWQTLTIFNNIQHCWVQSLGAVCCRMMLAVVVCRLESLLQLASTHNAVSKRTLRVGFSNVKCCWIKRVGLKRNCGAASAEKWCTTVWFCTLWRRANAQNVSLWIPLRWPIHIINPVDRTKFVVGQELKIESVCTGHNLWLCTVEPLLSGHLSNGHSQIKVLMRVRLLLFTFTKRPLSFSPMMTA